MEAFLRVVFDSLQRSPALTFSLCLSHGKCLPCKSEIRSEVVPACLTRCLRVSGFALCDFSSQLCHHWGYFECSFWGRKTPVQRDSLWVGAWKRYISPVLSGYLFHLVLVEGQRKPVWGAYLAKHGHRPCQHQHMTYIEFPDHPRGTVQGGSDGPFSEREAPQCGAQGQEPDGYIGCF